MRLLWSCVDKLRMSWEIAWESVGEPELKYLYEKRYPMGMLSSLC